uniref:Uncharacterized protein n=1 Tax=Panagrolaimus sp. PS1159 TaxID=55785 RepID=A0AC35FDJ6_9BILA
MSGSIKPKEAISTSTPLKSIEEELRWIDITA